jgi:hypothetical protein
MDLSPNEQLSKPSFEKLKSGIVFGGGDPAAGEARRGTLDFEQILRDPELEEDSVGLPGFNLAADPRAAELGQIASGQGTNRFAISSAEAPIQVESPGYAVRDRLTGEVLANTKHWTAGRSSDLGRKASSTVVPAWEVSE